MFSSQIITKKNKQLIGRHMRLIFDLFFGLLLKMFIECIFSMKLKYTCKFVLIALKEISFYFYLTSTYYLAIVQNIKKTRFCTQEGVIISLEFKWCKISKQRWYSGIALHAQMKSSKLKNKLTPYNKNYNLSLN